MGGNNRLLHRESLPPPIKTSERATPAVKPLTNSGPHENYGNVLYYSFLDLTVGQIKDHKRLYLDKLTLSDSKMKMLEMRTSREY